MNRTPILNHHSLDVETKEGRSTEQKRTKKYASTTATARISGTLKESSIRLRQGPFAAV
jgi:hypothetical protein